MLKTKLLHPPLLRSLSEAGHGAQILIADGNFPVSTATPPSATKIFLNLMPGVLDVSEVLDALTDTIPVEKAMMMTPVDGSAVPVHDEFRRLLPSETAVSSKPKPEFYEAVASSQTALVIATGEQRRFANLLLTVGVVKDSRREQA